MAKQNQILAIEKGVKKHVYTEITNRHKQLQKKELLEGLSRTYRPKDDEGERYPNEEKLVQIRAHEVLTMALSKFPEIYDITYVKDSTNCVAKADIVVDAGLPTEQTLASGVPATYLLWLEKQLNDLHTFVRDLPTLSSDQRWEWDGSQNCWRSVAVETAKKKK
ncbi:MAG: DUF7873 family protein, partial [bacterium]